MPIKAGIRAVGWSIVLFLQHADRGGPGLPRRLPDSTGSVTSTSSQYRRQNGRLRYSQRSFAFASPVVCHITRIVSPAPLERHDVVNAVAGADTRGRPGRGAWTV